MNNITQVIQEANFLLNENIIEGGNFVKETFNILPTASSLRLQNENISKKMEENLAEYGSLTKETFNYNQET
jgi:hypothetical protein